MIFSLPKVDFYFGVATNMTDFDHIFLRFVAYFQSVLDWKQGWTMKRNRQHVLMTSHQHCCSGNDVMLIWWHHFCNNWWAEPYDVMSAWRQSGHDAMCTWHPGNDIMKQVIIHLCPGYRTSCYTELCPLDGPGSAVQLRFKPIVTVSALQFVTHSCVPCICQEVLIWVRKQFESCHNVKRWIINIWDL